MVIRFQCGSCSQPIEVDDEWALKTVACPYCSKTITAPAESTITDLSRVPTASPLTAGNLPAEQEAPSPPAVAVAEHANRIAVASIMLACGVVVQLFVAGMLMASHSLEMEWVQERVSELQKEKEDLSVLAASQQAWMEYYQSRGGMPPGWMIAAVLLELSGGITWIATMVCALIALRRPRRRGLAVTALLVGGLVPILFCCSGFAFGSQA